MLRSHGPAALLLAAALAAVSCAGYRLGDAKPAHLAQVKAIHVPLFRNDTLEPRLETLATNETVAAFQQDGTFRVASANQADAVLEAKVAKVDYATLRTRRLDTLRPFELRTVIQIQWTLKDARNPGRVIDQGLAAGTSSFFLDDNAQTSRTNSFPDAMRDAARSIVSHLADGL